MNSAVWPYPRLFVSSGVLNIILNRHRIHGNRTGPDPDLNDCMNHTFKPVRVPGQVLGLGWQRQSCLRAVLNIITFSASSFLIVKICCCKWDIFGFWTVGQTIRCIWTHFVLWEIVLDIFIIFWYFTDQQLNYLQITFPINHKVHKLWLELFINVLSLVMCLYNLCSDKDIDNVVYILIAEWMSFIWDFKFILNK